MEAFEPVLKVWPEPTLASAHCSPLLVVENSSEGLAESAYDDDIGSLCMKYRN